MRSWGLCLRIQWSRIFFFNFIGARENIKIETDFTPQQSEALLVHVHLSMNKQRFRLLRFEFGSGSVRVHANACCLLASVRAKDIGTASTRFPADCVLDSNPLGPCH